VHGVLVANQPRIRADATRGHQRGFKMQSFENKPSSPTKRLGVSLNVDTGYKGKAKEISPPQTPRTENPRPSKGNNTAANRALRARTGPRETFLDDITPVDRLLNKENDPEKVRLDRDSHDLSLSPRQVTRDSLVDHMLLSLDQFSFGKETEGFGRQPIVEEERLYSSFGEEEPYQPTSNFAPRNGRVGHSYSYSSDYDNADDSSRYSGGQLSRGRRSNSSSNFQSGLGRINSKRNEKGSISSFGTSRGQLPQIPPRGLHSRSGKGSKGSSANSFDLGYAQVTSNQRWAHGLAGRSSSFDYGSDRQTMNAQPSPMARQIETNIPAFDPYDYDAAPTPTVPVGPRRTHPSSPIIIPQPEPTPVEPGPQKLERKRSTRSSKSAYKGKLSGNASSGGRFDYGLKDRTRELPPLPAFNKESAPAPLVGYGKAKDTPQPSPGLTQPSKDKPGFFRRVFGSSRNNPAPEPPPSHGSTTSAETMERPSSKPHHIATQLKSQLVPPPREPPPPPKEHAHVLTKKPSSFFRRRKKSVSEAEPPVHPPMVPPLMLQPKEDPNAGKTLPSPVSSLRKVMNPYLRTPARSPIDPYPQADIGREMNASPELNNRAMRGFSPDYEPDKSATIRTVRPIDGEDMDNAQSSGSLQNQYLSSSNAGPDSLDGTREERDGTFLQDSSDNDRDVPSGKENVPWPRSPKIPSKSVARDIALVAEYERLHSKRSPTPATVEATKSSPISEALKSPSGTKSDLKQTVATAKDEEWVMLTPTKSPTQLEEENRVWLEPSSSEEDLAVTNSYPALKVTGPPGRLSGSTDTVYKSATSLPIVQIECEEEPERPERRLMTATEAIKSLDELLPDDDEVVPTDSDCERAKKVYDGNEDFIQREKAAAWMGEEGPLRTRTLIAYMELYDFANLNILAALRLMCGRLVLKAESQQVDRILVVFSRRWCQCNPNHGFKDIGRFFYPYSGMMLTNFRCRAHNLLLNSVAEH
jgi:hypothetical protein